MNILTTHVGGEISFFGISKFKIIVFLHIYFVILFDMFLDK